MACLMLAASGAIRVDQERRFATAADDASTPPFSMRSLPEKLGNWRMQGKEGRLPKETIQIAGCSDYMTRVYVDDTTGVALTVLVAFGPAERVFGHAPTICFPAFGYNLVGGPWRRQVAVETSGDGPSSVGFDALAYSKAAGGVNEMKEVYYSFRHDGRWSPGAEQTRQYFRHRPAMFKVQVERPIVPGEVGAEGSPSESFLKQLIPEIERRLASPSAEARTVAEGEPEAKAAAE